MSEATKKFNAIPLEHLQITMNVLEICKEEILSWPGLGSPSYKYEVVCGAQQFIKGYHPNGKDLIIPASEED